MNVLVTGRLPDDVLALIKKEHNVEFNLQDRPMDRERIILSITDKDGILCMITDSIDRELLDKAPNLKIIANLAVGFLISMFRQQLKGGFWLQIHPVF